MVKSINTLLIIPLSLIAQFKFSLLNLSILLFLSLSLVETVSLAETVEETTPINNSVYPASFFAQYGPQNAKDMIDRLPGFNFDPGSNDRGFGGNAGNVLIDGVRHTSKSSQLDQTLAKIPATQVLRIEIIRGGAGSGEASGQSIVANIIRNKEITTGSWAFKERWAPKGKPQPNLEASIATKLGQWDTAFNIDIGSFSGYRTANINNITSNDQLLWTADEILKDKRQFGFINGEVSQQFTDAKLTITARLGASRFKEKISRDIFNERIISDTLPDQLWQLNSKSTFDIKEIGVDWSQKLSDWQWRVIGIGLVQDNEFNSKLSIIEDDELVSFNRAFKQKTTSSETILRSTFSNKGTLSYAPEFGLEIAKNKLTSQSNAFNDSVEIILNGGDVIVEELRGELFTSFNYSYSEKLTLEGRLTAEFSTIEVSGDASQKQSFQFIKPRFSAKYKMDDAQQLTLELERRVGQLNFNDFAASSEESDDRTTSGNPNLQPDKTTELALTYDWSFSQHGSLKVKVFYEKREDILEQIILPSGGQGLGNAGDADFYGIITDLNIPLDGILDHGLIEISHVYRDSSFFDSIINDERILSNYTANFLTFKLRQDLNDLQLAWGIEYMGQFKDKNFFVDEIVTFSANRRFRFFIETSRFFDVKVQLEVSHANTGLYDRVRYIYDTDRSGELTNIQTSNRKRRPEIKLTFSKSF